MESLTFEDLPRAMGELLKKVNRIEERVFEEPSTGEQMSDINEPMTTKEVAVYLNVSIKSVYNYIDRGALPYFKIGRKKYFKRSEVDKALKVK